MMYGSSDIGCNRQSFLSFWTIFCPEKLPEDIIILHRCNINDNHDVWFLRYRARLAEFFAILDHFLPFYPPNNPKNQNFEKMKKPPGDIITLHMCNINENHMMYGS